MAKTPPKIRVKGQDSYYDESKAEESLNFADLEKSKLFRKNVERILNTRMYIKKTFLLPIDIFHKMEYVYYHIFENSITFNFFSDVLASISTSIFLELAERGMLRSQLDFLRFISFLKRYLPTIMESSQNSLPFVQLHLIKLFTSEFIQRGYTQKQQGEFFHFLQENCRDIFNDKPVLNYDDIQELFTTFELNYKGDIKMLVKLFDSIKNTTKKKEKVFLLKSYAGNMEELKQVLLYAYSKKIVFDLTAKNIGSTSIGIDEKIPIELFSQLSTKNGRIEKIKFVESKLQGKTIDVRKYTLAILDKDLGIGINTKLINEAFPNLIPEFKLMLAHKQTKEAFHRIMTTPWCYVNLKIDGIRCVVNCKDKNNIEFYSRDGYPLQEFLTENIKKDIVDNFEQFNGKILDGEIYSESFQKLMKIVQRTNIDSNALSIRNSCKFGLFDIIVENVPLENRVDMLAEIKDTPFIQKIKYLKVKSDYAMIKDIATKYINLGREGIIVKHPQSFYEYKRSLNWMKFKNRIEMDVIIVDTEEGEGKNVGKLGALVVKLDNGNTTNVGYGFTDEERQHLWNIREEIIGKTCEIEFMEVTEGGKSLRHAGFQRIRFDRN
jgi:DNA ligase 1